MPTWMLMVYKVPNEPSANRVYVWRKLKKLGALLLHDAVWVLPATPRTRGQLRWLAAEVVEMSGEASVWESRGTLSSQDEELVGRFTATVQGPYRDILADLRRKDLDLAALVKRFRQVRAQDYFDSELGTRVRDALAAAARGGQKR